MKKLLVLSALSLACLSALAQSQSGADASNAGNVQQIVLQSGGASSSTISGETTQNIVSSGGTNNVVRQEFGSQTIKNVPSVSGPQLTTSNDTCMGSSSGSANGPGFGLSVGSTWTDTNCKMLKNSRELWNMGMKGAAMALMCTDPANREALEITGYECPQTKLAREKLATAKQAEPTDPYVRARLGLPAN